MKNILACFISIFCIFSALSLEAKNYTRKAVRPAASDHTWQDYEYNFNLDENGNLTGTNTFTKVYNASPTRWKNSGYYGEYLKMYTGYETLTITVLPGKRNYKYTVTSNVVEWQWDTHLLKWVKNRFMPANGTRTFTIKDGKLNGPFEVPVISSPFGITFMCGNSSNGVIPNGETIRWKFYDYTESTPQPRMEIKSEGSNTRINVTTYLKDVEKIDIDGNTGLGSFAEGKSGYYVKLDFPFIKKLDGELPLLLAVGDLSHIGLYELEKYSWIPLPDIYDDNYVNPYDPVTKILDNGHKLVSTLQKDKSVYTEETWEENGYSYFQKYDGTYHPAVGRKEVGDTVFLHYKGINGKNSSGFERGFITGKKYYVTEHRGNSDYSIDYTHAESDGYIVINIEKSKRVLYAYSNNEENKPMLSISEFESYRKADSKYGVFKVVDKNGIITVPADLTEELSQSARDFVKFVNHPYIKNIYPTEFSLKEITMNPKGGWRVEYSGQYNPSEKKRYEDYYQKMFRIMEGPKNPLKELQSSIGMELDIPDYDFTVEKKINAKIVGKRTAKLLKELPKWLNDKLGKDEKIKRWPNGVKKSFLKNNISDDFEKAWVSRIVKNGKDISVYVTTVGNREIVKNGKGISVYVPTLVNRDKEKQ